MNLWIVVHSHRHGMDVFPMFRDIEPSEDEILADKTLGEGGIDFDTERDDEYLEVRGPFDVPKPAKPIIIIEGCMVQEVFYPAPDPETGKPFTEVEYELVDYDIFDGSSNEEIADYFLTRSPEVQAYWKANLPDEYGKFKQAIDRHKRAKRKAKRKKPEAGRIQLPKGSTINERAKRK